MTATRVDYSQYVGHKVVLVQNLVEPNSNGEQAVEVEGVVQVANEFGIVLKPKGKTQVKLIETQFIEEVRPVDEKPKELKAKELRIIKYGQARTHLLERHAVTLKWVNETSEETALDYHNSIDHELSQLGHIHVDKTKKKSDSSETPDK